MSTQVFTLDDLNVEEALGLDPFGSLFRGIERSSGDEVIILGITPPAKQKLTKIKLQQSLRGVLSLNHEHIAPIVSYGLLSEEQRMALHTLTSQVCNVADDGGTPPQAYTAYRVLGAMSLRFRSPWNLKGQVFVMRVCKNSHGH